MGKKAAEIKEKVAEIFDDVEDIFANTKFGQIDHMLSSERIDGKDGLYFRTAFVASQLTFAKHGIVVVPSTPGMLKVVGCTGAPMKDKDEGEFKNTRGVIGESFTKATYILEPNVNERKKSKKPYYSFDDKINSELAVPIIDFSHPKIEAVINVESEALDHFRKEQAWMLHKLGLLMLLRRKQLNEIAGIREQQNRLSQEKENLQLILDVIPDEIMIIDKDCQPFYANPAKRDNHKRLGAHLETSSLTLQDLFNPQRVSVRKAKDLWKTSCYYLIEEKTTRCDKCVCKQALDSKKAITGVIYEPEKLDQIVELSAAPIPSSDGFMGSVETARYITKRQRALEVFPNLLDALIEDELLEKIIKCIHDNLKYDRVRLYSIDKEKCTYSGVYFEGEHPLLTMDKFCTPRTIPAQLHEAFLKQETTGRISVSDKDRPIDKAKRYWKLIVSDKTMQQIIKAIDPENLLELEGISEFAISPLITRENRWLVAVDLKSSEESFESDDLQALTIFTNLASSALEAIEQNKLRFKLAVVGQTAFSLEHVFSRYCKKPEDFSRKVFEPLTAMFDLGVEYLQKSQSQKKNRIIAKFINLIKEIIERPVNIPSTGDIIDWTENLKEQLQQDGTTLPDSYTLDAFSRVICCDSRRMTHWRKDLKEVFGDPTLRDLLTELVTLIVNLKDQERIPWEIRLFANAFTSLGEKPGKLQDVAPRDIIKITSSVVKLMRKIPTLKRVQIVENYPDQLPFAEVKPGELFLALQALIQNAADAAAKASQPKVIVSVEQTQDDHGQEIIKISISNNGDRIKKEYWTKIGKRPIINPEKEGATGLGLIFIYGWVDSSGGKIEPSYDEETGLTTFEVSLKLAKAA